MNENKSYCTFGTVCKNSADCDKLLTQSIVNEHNKNNKSYILFVLPPKDCFSDNRGN